MRSSFSDRRRLWLLLGLAVLAAAIDFWALGDALTPRAAPAYRDYFIRRLWDCPDPDLAMTVVPALPWRMDFSVAHMHRCAEGFGTSWNTLEDWGVWSRRRDAAVTLRLAPGVVPHAVLLRVGTWAPPGQQQDLRITIDGRQVARYTLPGERTMDVSFPLRLAPGQRMLTIGFRLGRIRSPAQVGPSLDGRYLGVALSRVALE
jgi:hypothetical protein